MTTQKWSCTTWSCTTCSFTLSCYIEDFLTTFCFMGCQNRHRQNDNLIELTAVSTITFWRPYDNFTLSKWQSHSFSGLYISARDHFTHERCTRGTPINNKKLCGLDFHHDIDGSVNSDYSDNYSILRPDYSAQGHYATHLFTDHAIKLIQAHNSSQVFISILLCWCFMGQSDIFYT